MGNLTRDPEIKYTAKGTAVCEISIAVNKTWKDQSGAKQEKVSFFGCSAFGKTAEVIAEHFKKGKPILIEGELTQDTWEDKESGKKREKTKVQIDSFQFVGGRDEGGTSAPRQSAKPADRQAARPASPPPRPPADPDLDAAEDDIPF